MHICSIACDLLEIILKIICNLWNVWCDANRKGRVIQIKCSNSHSTDQKRTNKQTYAIYEWIACKQLPMHFNTRFGFFFMCVTCSKIVSSIVCYLVAYYHNDQIKNNYLCWNFVYHRSPFVDVILMANNKIESNKMEWDWALHIVGDLFIHSCLSLNNKDIHRFFFKEEMFVFYAFFT